MPESGKGHSEHLSRDDADWSGLRRLVPQRSRPACGRVIGKRAFDERFVLASDQIVATAAGRLARNELRTSTAVGIADKPGRMH